MPDRWDAEAEKVAYFVQCCCDCPRVIGGIDDVATALRRAFREGLERAAEMLEHGARDLTPDMRAVRLSHAAAIRREIEK